MAINFTVSYTFSPSTTISSSQVNTNTSDVSNVFTGLEALTKSFSNLRVDTTPTTTTDVAIKSYVDKLNGYRRPVLTHNSVTTTAVEAGLDGTSGDIPLLFSDGTSRTETSTTRTSFVITRNVVLTTSGAQSGLTGATSEAANTWYALYGAKVTDSSTLWCTVGTTVIPTQANFATLNTAYGTNGWVYLGMIRNGDNSGATSDILQFGMAGNKTSFYNNCTGNSLNSNGLRLASQAGAVAASLTYTFVSGTGTTQIPIHLPVGAFTGVVSAGAGTSQMADAANAFQWAAGSGASRFATRIADVTLALGVQLSQTNSVAMDIYLSSFTDAALGVGANPLL